MMNLSHPGGFWRRLAALFIDGIIIGAIISLCEYLYYGQVFLYEETSNFEFVSILYVVLLPVFWSGYTVGKRLLGIRIARIDGKMVGVGTMLMRQVVSAILYTLSIGILYIVSIFMVIFRQDKRSVHDFIAKTYVTTEPVEK